MKKQLLKEFVEYLQNCGEDSLYVFDNTEEAIKKFMAQRTSEVKASVFLFEDVDGYTYTISAEGPTEAMECLLEMSDMEIIRIKLVPETEWDEKTIKMYEDNDTDTEPFFMSIRECMEGNEPTFICTNNPDWID